MNEIKSIIDPDFSRERMSFLQLADKYDIIIPVIQRDYAQGRLDEYVTEVRENFVRNLIAYLKDESNSIHDLDFVYGTVNKSSIGIDEFIPLDGQQRLTTLFLLHLYIAGRCGHFEDFSSRMKSKGNAYKFSYRTRNSSTMFCQKLLSKYDVRILNQETHNEVTVNTDIFEQLNKTEDYRQQADNQPKISHISETIKDQGWFHQSWLQDPTIAGMLAMLAEIDYQFLNTTDSGFVDEAYKRVFEVKDNYQPITFQLMPLNGYSRTDDLYIKLNARGIHLTDFENFKARIEDLMKMDCMDCTQDFQQKVDGKWNDFLWKVRGSADNTDQSMENLFRNFIAMCYRTEEKDKIDDRLGYLLELNGKKMRFTYYRYCELKVMHRRDEVIEQKKLDAEKNMIQKVINFFDIFCTEATTPENSKCKWLRACNFIHQRNIDTNASYSNRLRLYAYLQYHNVHQSIDLDDLNQWMRLIRNLDDATDKDKAELFYQALVSIDDMLENIGNNKIQNWLATQARFYKVKFFRSRVMKEECIKAELMARESDFKLDTIKQVVEVGDDDTYLTGQMGFALEFAGAYEKYNSQSIQTISQTDLEKLGNATKEYTEKTIEIIRLLKVDKSSIISERLLERALLTLGMYLRKNSAKRLNFCNRINDPYNSWKTLLFVEDENKYSKDIFKSMLDSININNIEADLKQIISVTSKIPTWRKLLIDNKELIDYCTQGFIYIEDWSIWNQDDVDVILLSQKQMNHYHSELCSRELFERMKGSMNIGYHIQRKYNDDTTIYIPFIKDNEYYEYQLSHWNGKWSYWIIDKENNDVSNDFSLTNTDMSNGEQILSDVFVFLENNKYDIEKIQ